MLYYNVFHQLKIDCTILDKSVTSIEYIPSGWVCTQAMHIPAGSKVLDVAAGYGRNARWLADQGYQVQAVDKDMAGLQSMDDLPNITTQVADIEADAWPYEDSQFEAIVVCRYLHRPLFSKFIQSLARGGILIYETFMDGHQVYGRPQNPDFLLNSNELLQVFSTELTIIAFEQGLLQQSPPAMMQRICAIKN